MTIHPHVERDLPHLDVHRLRAAPEGSRPDPATDEVEMSTLRQHPGAHDALVRFPPRLREVGPEREPVAQRGQYLLVRERTLRVSVGLAREPLRALVEARSEERRVGKECR